MTECQRGVVDGEEQGGGSLVTCDLSLTILVHGHQVAAGLEMNTQLKEDELS